MASMSKPSARLILRSRRASRQISTVDAMSIMRSMVSKLAGEMEPETAIGKASTMQILKMLLPTMLPTSRSLSPFLAAVTVVTSSGSEVPSAITEREMMRSEIPMVAARKEAELTTSSLPPTTPSRPAMTKKNDLPSLYSGFSTFLLSLRFLRAREMR